MARGNENSGLCVGNLLVSKGAGTARHSVCWEAPAGYAPKGASILSSPVLPLISNPAVPPSNSKNSQGTGAAPTELTLISWIQWLWTYSASKSQYGTRVACNMLSWEKAMSLAWNVCHQGPSN